MIFQNLPDQRLKGAFMRICNTALAIVIATLIATQSTEESCADTGLVITNGRLYEANGNEIIMRGVNHMHTWYQSQTGSIADVKSLGCNTVRIALSSGDRWQATSLSSVANVIALCKQHRMLCVLEVHDTTGYGDEPSAGTLDQAVDYWITLKSILQGEEDYVMINIGNEPIGNAQPEIWMSHTISAIQRMRTEGFEHVLIVDAPNWGQDWTQTMYTEASAVFAADSQANTMFSIHMYGVYDTAQEITDYLEHFINAGLPISIGEFGHLHSDGDVDEDTIFSECERLGIGYLGWAWSGNGGGVEYLDMSNNFDMSQLSSWGQRIFFGANGIASTSSEATIFQVTTPVVAESYQVTRGKYLSGTLEDTQQSDNSRLIAIRGVTDVQPRINVEFQTTSPSTNPVRIDFEVESSVFSRGAATHDVDLYNFRDSIWETFDSNVAMSADSVVSVTVDLDPDRFVETATGQLRSRIRFENAVQRARYQGRIDNVVWKVTE